MHNEEYSAPHWDVINEMVGQGAEKHTSFLDHTGDPEIRKKLFKHVKEPSADTMFFVNDFGIILNKNGHQ
jgi:GH35 family endo-1,4-beta-xylanase